MISFGVLGFRVISFDVLGLYVISFGNFGLHVIRFWALGLKDISLDITLLLLLLRFCDHFPCHQFIVYNWVLNRF